MKSLTRTEIHQLTPPLSRDAVDAAEVGTTNRPPSPGARPRLARVEWRRLAKWTLFFPWLTLLFYLFLLLNLWVTPLSYGIGQDRTVMEHVFSPSQGCQPGGKFSPYSSAYSPWVSGDIFEITLGFGAMSFTQAKVIDIGWDLLVGRGGQGAIAYVSWRVFANFMAVSMERSRPVSYETFSTVFLQQEASLMGTYRLMTDASLYRALRYKTVAVFTVLSLFLIMAFPTLASAMTGYVAQTAAYVKDSPGGDGNYILFNEFVLVAYVIHDAWRINKTGDLLVPYSPTNRDPMFSKEVPLLSEGGDILSIGCYTDASEPDCKLYADTSRYITEYGFYGLTEEPSVWAGQTQLQAPALNITAYFLGTERRDPAVAGCEWVHPVTKEKPFQNPAKATYMLSNRTYNLSYIQQYGACQPDLDIYQWGFSYIQFYILVVMLLAWTLGIWAIWLKAHINLPLANKKHTGEVPKGWTALLHLASTMQNDLSMAGIDPTSLTDGQLRYEIRQRVRGGGMIWLESADASNADPLDVTVHVVATARTTTTRPEVLLGRFLWQKTKELKWVLLTLIPYFAATVYGVINRRNWPTFVISWLCCFGVYGFLFAGRMRWLLWVYVPCSCTLGTVTIFMAQRAIFLARMGNARIIE